MWRTLPEPSSPPLQQHLLQQAPPHVPHPDPAQQNPLLAAPNPRRAPAPRVQQPAARPRARHQPPLYDTLYFFFHLALHTILPLRSFYPPHNAYDAQLNPQATNQMHVFERLSLVLLANFSLNVIGSHVLTRTAFVPVLMWLLGEIHSGPELPWGYAKVLSKGWGRGGG